MVDDFPQGGATNGSALLEALREASDAERQALYPKIEPVLAAGGVGRRIRASLIAYSAVSTFDRTGTLEFAARNGPEATIQLYEFYTDILRFDIAKRLLQHYTARWPKEGNLAKSYGMVADLKFLRDGWRSHRDLDVQIAPKPGASTTFVVFTGRRHEFGIHINTFHHCWMTRFDANLVYVRDFNETFYREGISSLGGLAETIAGLKKILAELGTRKVVCVGNSAGVFGALYYGALLRADMALAFSGPTSIELGIEMSDRDVYVRLAERREKGETFPDLRELYREAPAVKAEIYFGTRKEFDRRQAENLAGISNVRLHPLDTAEHFILDILAQSGELERIFAQAAKP